MNQARREELVYQVMTGELIITIGGTTYILKPADPHIRLRAATIYKDTIRDSRFDSWLTDKGCLHLLVKHKMCSADIDANIKTIDKEIENLKVRLFTSLFIPDVHSKTRKHLEMVKIKQLEMLATRHCFDHLTATGFAEMVKRQYLVFETLYVENNSQKVWTDQDKVDSLLLEQITSEMISNSVDIAELREVARNDPWRNYWNINKGNPFNLHDTLYLTDEQRTLVLFSRMYDSAYEHPNCPPDDVIKDDDLFDGWMLYERRKNEKDKITSQFEERMNKRGGKMKDSDEVFLVAKSKEDAARINALNDTHGHIVKAQRKAVVKRQGKAVDANFQDRKIQLQQARNEQFIQTVKGKR